MISPKVSVIMGVYNCSKTICEAITSVQAQTFENWELIVCDDGSTDDTWEILSHIAKYDSRIFLLQNQANLGLNKTLNKCLETASGEYIARMDGDDVSLPTRFQKQVFFLDEHPEFSIVSSLMIYFDEQGEWGVSVNVEYPSKEDVVCGSPICHAPSMMRREALVKIGGYSTNKSTKRVEDVDLWIRMYETGYYCYNIQEPLYKMRNDANALNRRKYRYRINSTITRIKGCSKLHLGLKCYIQSFKPMLVGLIPSQLRRRIKRFTIKK